MFRNEDNDIEVINNGIQDWLGIIDYNDKKQASWCRRNITELKRAIKEIRKDNKRLS